ncbi:unnamed protein product [Caenorhabditis sp. 36 PRJEB53466]|nr:unnamed protein product [Caenorhabditis sp. 36 PRJEB53466]
MRFFALAFLFALFVLGSACIGGSGSQCCPQAQPSCGNPCGAGVGPAPVGPVAYVAPPPAYGPANAYAVGK